MIALAERPIIESDADQMDPKLCDMLIEHLSTMASVFHKPPSSFARKSRFKEASRDQNHK
jgi:AP-1 complex subunit beta-1